MAELFWFALGFMVATYMFHEGFKNYINSKLRKKKKETPVDKVEKTKKTEKKKKDKDSKDSKDEGKAIQID